MARKVFCAVLLTFAFMMIASADDFMPLRPGTLREYSFTRTNPASTETAQGTYSIKSLPSREFNGIKLIPVQNQNGTLVFYTEKEEGIVFWGHQNADDPQPVPDERPEIVMPKSHAKNTRWNGSHTTSLLKKRVLIDTVETIEATNETVNVPAGVFKNCIRIRYIGQKTFDDDSGSILQKKTIVTVEGYEWYALGVGPVKAIVTETGEGYLPEKEEGKLVVLLTKFSR